MANLAAAAIIASGIATRYNPLVMDAVVENRARWKQIDPSVEVEGYVALLDCDRLGDLVWLQAPDGRVLGPVMVADCAAAHHREARISPRASLSICRGSWRSSWTWCGHPWQALRFGTRIRVGEGTQNVKTGWRFRCRRPAVSPMVPVAWSG